MNAPLSSDEQVRVNTLQHHAILRDELRWKTSPISRGPVGTLLFFFLLVGQAFGLGPAKSISQFNCQNWTRQTGLPANQINTLAQASDGHLWPEAIPAASQN